MSQSLDINLHQNPNFDANSLKSETFRMTFQDEKYDMGEWQAYNKVIMYMDYSNGLIFHDENIDLLTPDWSWIFNSNQRHKMENDFIKPNQEFIDDAIAWFDDLQFVLNNKDDIFNHPHNQKLFAFYRISKDDQLIVNAEELIHFIFKYNYPILSHLMIPNKETQ